MRGWSDVSKYVGMVCPGEDSNRPSNYLMHKEEGAAVKIDSPSCTHNS